MVGMFSNLPSGVPSFNIESWLWRFVTLRALVNRPLSASLYRLWAAGLGMAKQQGDQGRKLANRLAAGGRAAVNGDAKITRRLKACTLGRAHRALS